MRLVCYKCYSISFYSLQIKHSDERNNSGKVQSLVCYLGDHVAEKGELKFLLVHFVQVYAVRQRA